MNHKTKQWIISQLLKGKTTPIQQAKNQIQAVSSEDFEKLSDEELYRIIYAGMSQEEIDKQLGLSDKAFDSMTDDELNAIIDGKLTTQELTTLLVKARNRVSDL